MSDFAFYWKNFAREAKAGDWPVAAWYSNDDHVTKNMNPGDRVWLFTAGDACHLPEAKAAYLVEVFRVQKSIKNSDEDKAYPAREFHFMLVAKPDGVHKIDPPLLVDAIMRPEGHSPEEHIGQLLQKPRKLKEEVVAKLRDTLKAERAEAEGKVFAE
jgi:hypothetical protein